MRRGMAGRGFSDRPLIAVTQRGDADVEAATRAQPRAIAQTYSGAANQATGGLGWGQCSGMPLSQVR
jgi:hypothetical protein